MYINQTDSTNSWLKQHSDCDVVWTTWQTAGRGQAGNSWESEQGKNILLSLRLRKPNVTVSSQFLLTMAISLAVQDVVAKQLSDLSVTIKWPNDIYVGNDKICGILIENTIANGTIEESIVGIGLNVNQTTWLCGAPNPVSLKQLTKQEYKLQSICNKLCESIHHPEIDFQAISYYAAPKTKTTKETTEIDPEVMKTFDKLGIPLEERAALAGNMAVDAVMDSVSVKTTFRETLAKQGIIFCSISEAVREYPELVKKYQSTTFF